MTEEQPIKLNQEAQSLLDAVNAIYPQGSVFEIGRASCRERV